MSWVYDSGLSAPVRTLIRNAVVTKLAPLTRAGGGWLETVIPIGYTVKGPSDEAGIDQLYSDLNGRTTAIAVSTAKSVHDLNGTPDRAKARLQIDLYLLSSHRRGLTEGRTAPDVASAGSNARDPGLDAALELAWMFLQDVDLGLGPQVRGLRMLEEEELAFDNEKTIWQQSWQVWVERDVNKLRASVQKLVQLHSTLKPVGDEPVSKHIVEDTNV